jgi:short-subunit dehydrogenase
MLARRDGGILNVSSLGGMVAGPYQAAYYASKAYVLSFTRALAWECLGRGVRISVLLPGPVRTEFHQRMGANHAFYMRLGAGIRPERVARMGYSGFMCGKQLIIPGLLGPFNALALKIIPHDLLLPVIGWFLAARSRGNSDV